MLIRCFVQLTQDELALVKYGSALAEWLGPYHDHTRPPPAAVLAEAAKQPEVKAGHPLKGIKLPQNGAPTNGSGKKEESPEVTDPPELVSRFFDGMFSLQGFLFYFE
jgi:N-terminal acetyltransferase B complex non-catalytic subunit